MKIGSLLLHERRHYDNVIDIFTSEDMESVALCIFRYLTVYSYYV
jgi:hypothetical protein